MTRPGMDSLANGAGKASAVRPNSVLGQCTGTTRCVDGPKSLQGQRLFSTCCHGVLVAAVSQGWGSPVVTSIIPSGQWHWHCPNGPGPPGPVSLRLGHSRCNWAPTATHTSHAQRTHRHDLHPAVGTWSNSKRGAVATARGKPPMPLAVWLLSLAVVLGGVCTGTGPLATLAASVCPVGWTLFQDTAGEASASNAKACKLLS